MRKGGFNACVLSVLLAVPVSVHARDAHEDARPVLPLWPALSAASPGRITERSDDAARPDRIIEDVRAPYLVVYAPPRPNGTALLVTPGGGYARIVLDKEGTALVPAFVETAGITLFVLRYRLPDRAHAEGADAPLADAQRAMRLIRSIYHNLTRIFELSQRENIAPFSAWQWLLWAVCWAVTGWYATASWRRGGQTLGMRPWRLKVQSIDGTPLRRGQLWLRFAVGTLSLLLGGVGVFIAGGFVMVAGAFMGLPGGALAAALLGVGLMGLGIFMVGIMALLTKWLIDATVWYARLHYRVVKPALEPQA